MRKRTTKKKKKKKKKKRIRVRTYNEKLRNHWYMFLLSVGENFLSSQLLAVFRPKHGPPIDVHTNARAVLDRLMNEGVKHTGLP